jgi:hypothetical protein
MRGNKLPRPTLTKFVRILLTMGSGESPWLIAAFVLGVVALGVFSNFVYSAIFDPAGAFTGGALVRIALGLAAIITLAYSAYRYDLRQAWGGPLTATFDEQQTAPSHRGLIWLMSANLTDLPFIALRHHSGDSTGQRLRHAWVVTTVETHDAFERLRARAAELEYEVEFHEMPINPPSIEASYRAVDQVFTVEAMQAGLKPEEVIADLTGGLKTMSAGMVLACLPHGRTMEYIESRRDEAGQPIDKTQHVVLVGVDFRVGA